MNDSTDPAAKNLEETARMNAAALGDIFKALKTIGFYPDGHPLRRESLRQAHRSMTGILDGKELALVIARSGFTTNDGGAPVENTPMVLSLAKELFLRRTQRLTFLPDLTLEDLTTFLGALTIEPQRMAGGNGVEELLRTQGVRTIWTNEISLSSIWAKREAMEQANLLQSAMNYAQNPDTEVRAATMLRQTASRWPASTTTTTTGGRMRRRNIERRCA